MIRPGSLIICIFLDRRDPVELSGKSRFAEQIGKLRVPIDTINSLAAGIQPIRDTLEHVFACVTVFVNN